VLVAVPLEAAEEAAERSVELVRVDLLMCLGGVLEDLANVLGNLGGLAHIDSGSLKLGCGVAEGQAAETAADLVPLKGRNDQPALALLAGTTCTAETMDVGLAVTGETDLDHVGDVGEIHTASCDVGREEDARLAVAEVIRSAGALALRKLGVDLKVAEVGEGAVARPEAATKLVEDVAAFCSLRTSS
jgi:hypothetical protein